MTGIIEPKEDGPYLVRNLSSLTDFEGAEIACDSDVVALCRCGKSNTKPFCDGTHRTIKFSSDTENPKTGEWQEYAGKNIMIHDNRRLCAHAGECTHGLASVWQLGQKPWIDPDGADVEAIIAVIDKCPSGALSYSIEGTEPDQNEAAANVCVSKNGPYHVTNVALNDSSRNTDKTPNRHALCRCGASKNKPFCDGSHWDMEFIDDEN